VLSIWIIFKTKTSGAKSYVISLWTSDIHLQDITLSAYNPEVYNEKEFSDYELVQELHSD
jgi:hypothetical protein